MDLFNSILEAVTKYCTWKKVYITGSYLPPCSVRARFHSQGQSHHRNPKAVWQPLAGSPWSACPQPGHRPGWGSAGGFVLLPGAGDGPRPFRIGPVSLLRYHWGRIDSFEGMKKGPGPRAGDNAGDCQVSFSLVATNISLSHDLTHIINPKLASMVHLSQ